MSQKDFFATLLAIFATVVLLSLAWEFCLEDRVLPQVFHDHRTESNRERWEFVGTAAFFSLLALIIPGIIGARSIRQDQLLRRTVIRLSQEDALTSLYNRRRITELLDTEIQRAARYATGFCLIMLDVDHFKSVNDVYGHQAGDRVLATLAGVVRSAVRVTDVVARWGGEEFMILSLNSDTEGAESLANKIRTRIEHADLGEIGPITASFGVTAFAAGDDAEAMVARVDSALYAAKNLGRNRVETVSARSADRLD